MKSASRAARAALLAALLAAGCTVTDETPTGLEKGEVKLRPGTSAIVGLRLAGSADPAQFKVTAPAVAGLTVEPTVVPEDGSIVAGKIEVHTALATPPGRYELKVEAPFGPQTLVVEVAAPAVANTPVATRRSTVAMLGRGVVVAVKRDGTVVQVGDGLPAQRVEGLAGIVAVSGAVNSATAIDLDGHSFTWSPSSSPAANHLTRRDAPDAIDVRTSTQGWTYLLRADGTVQQPGGAPIPGLTEVVAVRPYAFSVQGPTGQQNLELNAFLKRDGTSVLQRGPTAAVEPFDVIGATDIAPRGEAFLSADGLAFFRTADAAAPLKPFFGGVPIRAWESASYETFENQRQTFRSRTLFLTPDGALWDQGLLIPGPANQTVVDLFPRDSFSIVLSATGRLFAQGLSWARPTTDPAAWGDLGAEEVRTAAPQPEAGVFSEPIPFVPGQTAQVALRVRRAGFDGALQLLPDNVPAGITVAPLTLPAGATTATLSVAFAADATPRPGFLHFGLKGEGLERKAALPLALPRTARTTTVATNLAVKSDGTVWTWARATGGGPTTATQFAGLADITSLGGNGNLALDRSGRAFSWGSNSFGQLGRTTATDPDTTPTAITGVPAFVAIASGSGGGAWGLGLTAEGKVWMWGGTTQRFSATPTEVTGLPRIVDVGVNTSPSALDENGEVWLLATPPRKLAGGPFARLGLVQNGAPATIDRNLSIPADGFPGGFGPLLWNQNVAVTASGQVWEVDLGAGGALTFLRPDSDGASYADQDVLLKGDGSVWTRTRNPSTSTPDFPGYRAVPGLTGVAPTR